MEGVMNCWEYMNCGRIPGGENAEALGICPAYSYGVGQACWLVAGTFCGGQVQGTFAQKQSSCVDCGFYRSFEQAERSQMRGLFTDVVLMTTILDTIGALVVVLDPDGCILRFNRACEAATGYSFSEVRGRRIWDVFLDPGEIEAVKAVFGDLTAHRIPNYHENSWSTKAGEPLRIAWSNTVLLDDGGNVTHVIATGLDITERKRAEEARRESERQVRLLLDSTAEGIWGVDTVGKITFANQAAASLLGFADPSGLLGRNAHQLCHHTRPDGTPYPVEECEGALAARRGESIRVDNEIFWRADGNFFPVEYSIYPVLREGQVVGSVATFVDITRRRRAQEELRRSQSELRALAGQLISAKEEESKRLARELHDAFGQKLAVLNLQVSELESILSACCAPGLEKLRPLHEEIGSLAQQIHQLSHQLHPAVLRELGLEIAAESECSRHSRQEGIPVKFSAEGVPEEIPGDIPLCLYRVLQESLQNIRKHARAREIAVRLAGGGNELVLAVEDSGIGFDLNEARRKGGLGLVSMEERVRLVGGTIRVHSEPGRGTRVEVRCPLEGRQG